MFTLSFIWHGVILNDFNRLDYPRNVYLIASLVAYLIIGLIVSRAYYLKPMERFEKKPVMRGVSAGAVSGFVIYLIAFVIGISFGGRKLEYVIVDLIWQVIEQSAGGIAVGFTHIAMYNMGWIVRNDQ